MSITGIYKNQVFRPKWWSVFVNSFYFSRAGLHRNLLKITPSLCGVMLDFGCGTKPYRDLVNVDQYVGLDMGSTAVGDGINHAGHVGEKLDIDVFYDGKKIPFPDAHFDSALSSEVLEYVANLDEILGEIRRVLKPGANFAITVPFCWDQHEDSHDMVRFTRAGIRHALERNGFDIVQHEKSTTPLETIAQLFGSYVYKHFGRSSALRGRLLHLLFVSPIYIVSAALSKIMPDSGNLYLNHVILARRV